MEIQRRSVFSGKTNTLDLDVTPEQVDRWMNGELIQDVMPHLTPDEREFLKTGSVGTEWDDNMADDLAPERAPTVPGQYEEDIIALFKLF